MERFSGELLDGQSAAVRPVTLALDIGGLHLRDPETDGSLDLWTFAGLRVEVLGAGVLHLEHPNAPGAMLTSRDPGLQAALARSGVAMRAHARGRRLLKQMVIYGAALAVLVTGVYLSLPAVSAVLARRVPLQVEAQLGVQIETFFDDDYCRDPAAAAALEKLAARLAVAGLDGPRADRVDVIDWKMVNALTLPGGKILVTRGLLAEAEGPDELAGVLAHELEHVRQRHIMAHIIRGSILSLGWAVTVGDFSGLFMIDPSTAFALANQRFSRAAERAADAGALARLDAGRISRAGFAAFFRRIARDTDVLPAWLSTHPASADRLAAIGAGGAKGPLEPALSDAEWQAVKGACGNRKK